MDILLLGIRLLLAGVFAVAGVAKLVDLPGSRQAMAGFGVPAALAGPFGLLLPLAEIALALALLPAATAWWAALGALALLLVFMVGIVYNIARGRRPDCHCFGQLHSRPIGRATLLRNGALALLAAAVVLAGPERAGPSALTWLTGLTPLGGLVLVFGLLLLGVAAVQTWVVFHLLRQNGRLLLRVEALESHFGLGNPVAPVEGGRGLPVGAPAPAFELAALDGPSESLAALTAEGKPVLLLFSNPNCGACLDLLPEIAAWQRAHAGQLTIALIHRGAAAAVRTQAAEHGLAHLLLQRDDEVAAAYQVTGTPSGVLVDGRGRIASPLAAGAPALRALVEAIVHPAVDPRAQPRRAPIALDHEHNGAVMPSPVAVGDPAPAVRLPDLDGTPLDLTELHGRPVLLLFWNPGCGFCQRMLEELRAVLAQPAPDAPRLVVVSTGSIEANRSQAIPAPVLIDQGFSTGYAFGARGTPSAVLIDAAGKVAGPVVVGAPGVLALLRGAPGREPSKGEPAARPV